MDYIVYDKTRWHLEAPEAPEGLTMEQSVLQMAFFFRWCLENDLCEHRIAVNNAIACVQVTEGLIDCSRFFLNMFDGILTSDELSEEGNLFAQAYYANPDTDFAKKIGYYPDDFDAFARENIGEIHPRQARYFLNCNEYNYKGIKDICDQRYKQFLSL